MNPTHCDLCGRTLSRSGIYVDGKTKFGAWATMCSGCHLDHGGKLGAGFGQKYLMQGPVGDGEKPVWVKVAG